MLGRSVVVGGLLALALCGACGGDEPDRTSAQAGAGGSAGGAAGTAGAAGAGGIAAGSGGAGGCSLGEGPHGQSCAADGTGCSQPCSGRGSCIAGTTCECDTGYAGSSCERCAPGFARAEASASCEPAACDAAAGCDATACDGGPCQDAQASECGCTWGSGECDAGSFRICDVVASDGCASFRAWAPCPGGGACFDATRCGTAVSGLAAVQWGSDKDDYTYDLLLGSDGSVVVAGMSVGAVGSDIALGGGDFVLEARLGSTLGSSWRRQWGSAQWDALRALAPDGAGGLLAAGESGGLIGDASFGNLDGILLGRMGDGTAGWAHQWGTSALQEVHGLARDSQGNYVVTGYSQSTLASSEAFVTKLDSARAPQWTSHWTGSVAAGFAVVTDAADAVIVVGTLTDGTTMGRDVFARKLNADGDEQWTKVWGSSQGDVGLDVALLSTGEILVTGFATATIAGATGTGGVFLTKLDAAGNILWTQQFGATVSDSGRGLAVAADDSFYVVGDTAGALVADAHEGGDDVFIQKRDAQAEVQYTLQYGSSNSDRVQAGRLAADGTLYVAGYTNGSLPGFTNRGSWDHWLLQYKEP